MTTQTENQDEVPTLVEAHDSSLKFPLNEEHFFSIGETGGTSFTPAYELAAKLIGEHLEGYDRYVFFVGEGLPDTDETGAAADAMKQTELRLPWTKPHLPAVDEHDER